MDIYGKTEAVEKWAKKWPEFDGYLKLNATTAELGESSLVTNYNDVIVDYEDEAYIDGTAPRRYSFALNLILQWSDGYDDVNMESMKYASKLLDWVNDQMEEGNIPDFGEDAEITSIETEQNLPSLAAIFESEPLAQYTIAVRINYEE